MMTASVSTNLAQFDEEFAGCHGIEQALQDDVSEDDSPSSRGGSDLEPEYSEAQAFMQAKYFTIWHSNLDRQISQIVIHITAGQADYKKTVQYFQNPTNKGAPCYVSAHYVVGQDGDIIQMVRHNDIAFHASAANGRSIGIEHTARPPKAWGHNDPGLPPTESQYRSSARLVRWLCRRYELPLERGFIVGHAEADPKTSHEDCPIGAWDWDQFMSLVRAS